MRSLVNFNDMSDALDFVIKMAEKERIVLVIDDYDNLFHSVKDISIVMREYISRMFNGKNIMLILTGPEKFLSEQKFGKVPTSLVMKKLLLYRYFRSYILYYINSKMKDFLQKNENFLKYG